MEIADAADIHKYFGKGAKRKKTPPPPRPAPPAPTLLPGEVWEFIVPGQPHGYYAQAARNVHRMAPEQRRRALNYREFQNKVREYAIIAGIVLPLHSTRTVRYSIDVKPYYESFIHCDPGNVQKGVCDALFKHANDKYTGGSFPPPLYDDVNPRTEIRIERLS